VTLSLHAYTVTHAHIASMSTLQEFFFRAIGSDRISSLTMDRRDGTDFSNDTILITGCSGFLGKVILEKLLRGYSCKRIYLLIRVKKGLSVGERFSTDILQSAIFERMRDDFGSGFDDWARKSVFPIAGDLQKQSLGLSEENRRLLTNSVSVIIHAAASVDFDLPLYEAASVNIDGSLEMLSLAKSCSQLKVMCHVSTCYVNSNLRGFIQEKIYPGPFSISDCYSQIKSSSRASLIANKKSIIRDWPNTYTFTKFLTEHLLVEKRDGVPLIICRPSIIAASLNEPVPGWTDTISAASAVFLACGMGICPPLPGSIWNVADVVPVDICADMILLAASLGSQKNGNLKSLAKCCCGPLGCNSNACSVPVVHCGTSSTDQPMTWFAASDTVAEIFAEHPPPQQLMVRDILFFNDRKEWGRQIFLRSKLPQYVLGLMEKWSSVKGTAARAKKALSLGDRIVDVFGHFTENEWIFDADFARRFGKNKFNQPIDWHEYMHLVCYGMRRFCLNNPLAEVPTQQSLKNDVLQRSTIWRLDERDQHPRRCTGRDLRWVWDGVSMDYDVPSAERIEAEVLKKIETNFETGIIPENLSENPKPARREVISILRSLETRFDHATVRFFGYTLQKLFSSIFDRINVNESVLNEIRSLQLARPHCPILLLPTHRSYLDFLMLSYVLFAYNVKVPFIVAGEDFKKIPGINSILRRSGAFFMKRKFDSKNDGLYVSVFKTYCQQVMRDHGMVEFFLEGTRSRSGHSLKNKNGLLSFALELMEGENPVPDIFLVPVSMSFERVLEAETFPPELLGGRKEKESLSRILKAVSVLNTKYGRANIVFNEPISVKQLREQEPGICLNGIGEHVMGKLNETLTVMSTHAVATVLLEDRNVSEKNLEEIQQKVGILRDLLKEMKVETTLTPHGTCAYSVSKAVNTYFKEVVKVKDDKVQLPVRETDVLMLSYYKNQLLGPVGPEALITVIVSKQERCSKTELVKEAKWIGSIIGAPLAVSEQRLQLAVDKCIQSRMLAETNQSVRVNADFGIQLNLLSSLVHPLIDSLWLTLAAVRNNPAQGDVNAVHEYTRTMVSDGQTRFRESVALDWIKSHVHMVTRSGLSPKKIDEMLNRISGYRSGDSKIASSDETVSQSQLMISRM